MEILVATNTCSAQKNQEIAKKRIKNVIDPQQKFFSLFIEGLSVQKEVNTTVLSALPVSASTFRQKSFVYQEERINSAKYEYIPFRNGKFSRYISLIFSAQKYASRWCNEKKYNSAVIVDPLIPVVAIPTRIVAQKNHIPVGAVVTDIPSLTTSIKGRKESLLKSIFLQLYQKIADRDLLKYDFYITLTESLNEVANKKRKPYCIVEGFADSKDVDISSVHENYIMYAGGVYEKFGVKTLVEAFVKLNRKDIELWIFGEGPYASQISKITEKYPNVIYKGCVSTEEIVSIEKNALLLVNPRPTNEEFSKYSFPSKTMEYLLSGTPVASTRLPGIPNEYFNVMYGFKGDDVKSIMKGLEEILNVSDEQRLVIGRKGHDYVFQEKNNIVMAKKVVNLIEKVL